MIPRHHIARLVEEAIRKAQANSDLPLFDLPDVVVEHPRDTSHGDYASPVAMTLARPARMAPLKIAELIVANLELDGILAESQVAAPGFINLRLSNSFVLQQIEEIIARPDSYGSVPVGEGRKVQVEFVSANPTGPLTIGHGRGGVMGDTLARVMAAASYEVATEYYFNNAGRQIRMLGESLKVRYRQLLGHPARLEEDHYQGDYLYWIATVLVAQHGDSLLDRPDSFFSDFAEESVFASIRATLGRLGITFDRYFNEVDLHESGWVDKVLKALVEKGYAYEQDGAFWLKSTALDDDKDRVLIKSSGEPTYRMVDIAYHIDKLERGFDLVIDIFGSDHHATAPTVLMGMKMLGARSEFVNVILHQFVTLIRDGEPVKMSTRKGHFVTLDQLMDEVGVDSVRYFMLARSANSAIDFDMDLAREQSDKNPVYYIQNAHVRCAGIFRRWLESGRAADAHVGADLSLITGEHELRFLRKALELSELVQQVAATGEPHHLAFYAYELAATFHPAYENARVLHSEVSEDLALARLRFYRAAQLLFERVLTLMGMSAPEVM